MAVRTREEIQTTLDEAQAAESELSIFNSTSQVSIFTKFKYIIAICSNILEQIFLGYQTATEITVAKAAPGSDYWIQQKVLEFQYSATTPQVTTINADFVPVYPAIDETLRIITRCSVKTGPNKTCLIKVAKSDPPTALSGPELTSLGGYINNSGSPSTNGKGIGFAGVNYVVSSVLPDMIAISGNLLYDGQYNAVIKANVVAAINNYLANIDFDGIFRINKMIDYIQAVPGVIDFTPEDIAIRPDGSTFPSGLFYICQNFQILYASYPFTAGYSVGETTLGFTLGDNITFTAQN